MVGLPRYAIYFAPDGRSTLARFGRRWLGSDARTGEKVAQPALSGLSPAKLAAITSEPRSYGFHGTLKPPFALQDGENRASLVEALAEFAAGRQRFKIPPLKPGTLRNFLALMPAAPNARLARLSRDCIIGFERFRAPLSPADMGRDWPYRLTRAQMRLYRRCGYPFAFEEFRFHLTLTNRLAATERQKIARAIGPLVASLGEAPVWINSICLFEQRGTGGAFRLTRRFAFRRPA